MPKSHRSRSAAFIALVAPLCLSPPAQAGQDGPLGAPAEGAGVREAITLLQRGAFAAAREQLEPLAGQRDPDAAYVLGYMDARGLGGPVDELSARRRFVGAAMDGQPDAQFALAELAYAGRGVQRDWGRAYEWYNLAASKGHTKASYMLGVMHAEGQHVPQDMQRAAALYEQAAKAGYAPAQHQLASAYLEGEGRAMNLEAAARWFEAAAEQGDAESQYNLALLHESERLPGEPDLDATVKWMRAAAASDLEPAKISMGLLYLNGRGVERSPETAAAWFQEAATAGSGEGAYLYAAALAEGMTGRRDLPGALVWAEKALRASAGEPAEVIEERRMLRDQLRALTDREAQERARALAARRPTPAPPPRTQEAAATEAPPKQVLPKATGLRR